MSPPLARRLAVLLFAALLARSGDAAADTARTLVRTALRSKPAATGKTIERVPAEEVLFIIDKSADGGWFQVLFNGREGWIAAGDTAVTIDEPPPVAPTEPAPPVRSGPRREDWVSSGETTAAPPPPDGTPAVPRRVIVTGPSAKLLDRPRDDARAVGAATRGQTLLVSHASRDARFYLVELDGQRVAWIDIGAVAPAPPEAPAIDAAPATTPAAPVELAPAAASTPSVTRSYQPPRRFRIVAGAGAALGQIQQRFTSNGRGPLTNYGDKSGLVGADVALGLEANFASGFTIGLGGSYRYVGGADLTARAGEGSVILGLRAHDLEVLGGAGYRFGVLGGLVLSVRAGVRMLLDLIDQDYTVPVPSERILTLAVGGALEVPRLVGGLGVSIAGYWLPVGSRAESGNLGEGDAAGTTGYAVTATATYAFSDLLALFVAGRYTRASTHFDGTAARDPSITSADRISALSSIALGLRLSR